jgi:16S rRNA (adenine(1408)-N(1))-methyltransferase
MIDLGTGAGGAVLAAARRAPDTLAIGVDADAAGMREASRRAARAARKGGLPNVLFLAGTLSDLPDVLDGRVDELRVTLPWGSLLRDVLEPAPPLVERALRLLRPGGRLRLMLSLTERDARIGRSELDADTVAALVRRYGETGFPCVEARPTTSTDVTELGSSWAKRLGIPDRRSAWTIVLRRRDR